MLSNTSRVGATYTKAEDRKILTSRATDVQIATSLGRTVGAIRQRRYVLTK